MPRVHVDMSMHAFVTIVIPILGRPGPAVVGARPRRPPTAAASASAQPAARSNEARGSSVAPVTTLEARVGRARDVCESHIELRTRELVQAAVDEYLSDRIDEDELRQRKHAAHGQASAEHVALVYALDEAYGAYATAVKAREEATATEEAAAKKVEEALRAFESS